MSSRQAIDFRRIRQKPAFDRRTIEVGRIGITSVVADGGAAEKALAFDPVRLTDGIELSDDTLPALRSRVYALAAAHRR